MTTRALNDVACHREAMRMSFPELVSALRDMLGAKLVAYISSVGETRAIRQWAEGGRAPNKTTQKRLRLAYQAAKCIADVDGSATAQAWFQGLNPLLDDVSPARLLRDGDVDEDGPAVLAAERHFLAEG